MWQYCSPLSFLKKQTSKSVKVEASLFYFLFKDCTVTCFVSVFSRSPFLHYRILSSKPQTADELTVCILNNYPTILELFYLPENLSFFWPSFEHTEITKNLQLDTHSSGKMLQLSQNSRKHGSGSTRPAECPSSVHMFQWNGYTFLWISSFWHTRLSAAN